MLKKILVALVVMIAFLSGYLFNVWITHTEKKTNAPSINQNVVNFKPESKKPELFEKKFSNEELKTFKLINSFYKDFEYSEKYTVTSEDEKKMIFTKEKDLYFDSFISYDVIYSGVDQVNYWFDAGTAYRGHGSYYVIDDDTVIKIEKVVGTSSYSYEIFKNGVTIESKTRECDQWGNPIN